MPNAYVHRRRVEFAETDMAGIMHFSNYFRFMEATEHAFVRSLGFTLHEETAEGMRGFARVGAKCEYKRPLRYGDEVDIHLSVLDKDSSSITYGFAFHEAESSEPGKPLATGELRVVCVVRPPGEERIRAARLPEEMSRLIEPAS